ncbi:transcription factor [Theileria orientalis strain Shintoku]|uniref:Transcription factor n=1 Tax=Theileria orientalis strain Shintoku TaxID=869250 RepID=J4DQB2_THEOR|nr:transcription factor [Theileria orientalis strain Shintoku]BAM42149.1 transcription factor [Theileria orientalis strain Shintoku]|eukprot:XP_009692450.1 transcription factor [Theileria orientalis strain Shintoku]
MVVYNNISPSMSLEFLSDEYLPGECSDDSVDEDELNSFLMGELTEPTKPKKSSFADRFTTKLLKKKNKKRNRETFYLRSSERKKKKKNKTASQSSKLTPELEKLLQEATDLYLNKNFEEAVKILKELVRRAPGLHDPFHMLGLIYQNEFNDVTTATSYYLLAAHLVPTDTELWQRIGEMSQSSGNIDQAIYCFKKCQRDQDGELNEQAVFALAICYVEKKDYMNAAKRFGALFKLHPHDKLIANQLARCFQQIGDLHSSLLVLGTYFNMTMDTEILETILELNVTLSLYEDCYRILDDICKSNNLTPKALPVEHLVYYAVACLNLEREAQNELNFLYEKPMNVKYMFLIANHLCPKYAEESLKWFKRGFGMMAIADQLDIPTTLKLAKCVIADGNNHRFLAEVLKKALEKAPTNSEILITLADVLLQLGRNDEADELISQLTLNDLDKIRDIPEPIPEEERMETFRKLNSQIREIEMECLSDPKIRIYPCLLSYESNGCPNRRKMNEWIDVFLKVVKDCELDTERAIQRLNKTKNSRANTLSDLKENMNKDENSIFMTSESKKSISNKSYSFLKIKKELNLNSAEDILGWNGYEKLIYTASVFMCLCKRVKEAVEMLEMISNNKKKYKSNLDSAERKNLIKRIEYIIAKCSSFGGLFKIAITYARNNFLKDPYHGSLEEYALILGTGKLAHAALLPLSSSNEKDTLLENRAWVTRQLLQYPENFQLLMLGGHYCTMSGNWSFATQEYERAYQKKQNDSLVSLCLATSHLNSLNSKMTDNFNKSLVLGLSFMKKYVDLRMKSVEHLNLPEPVKMVFEAEGMYNMARAYHFMKMFDLAVPLYEKCLDVVSTLECGECSSDAEVECPCIVCEYCRTSARSLPSSCKGFTMASFLYNHARIQLQRVQFIQSIGRYID